METTLQHVLEAAGERKAALTPETAGYLALAVADAVLSSPCMVQPSDVRLDDEGNVSAAQLQPSDPLQCEQSVRDLLRAMLGISTGAASALIACSQRPPGIGLDGLVAELESALIPVNRAAARRSIARLARESIRAASAASAAPRSEVVRAPAPVAKSEADGKSRVVLEAATEAEYTEPSGVPPVELIEEPEAVTVVDSVVEAHEAPAPEDSSAHDEVLGASLAETEARTEQRIAGFSAVSERPLASEIGGLPLTPTPLPALGGPDEQNEPRGPGIVEFHRPRAPRLGFSMVVMLLVIGLSAAVLIYVYYPSFFTGR